MSSKDLLQQLIGYKHWANRELFEVLRTLPATTPAESRHMMLRLLNHVFVVDQIFRAHLSDSEHNYQALNTLATPSLENLTAAIAETDQWYLDYAAQLSPTQAAERLDFRFVDGQAGQLSRAEMLLHVVNHGTYHRGAVGELLHQCGVNPPRDVLTRYL